MIPLYAAGNQLIKVRFILLISLICAAGSLFWAVDLAQNFGLAPGDGGVLASLVVRLAWAGGVSLLGVGFAAGMLLYTHLYIAVIVFDQMDELLFIDTAHLWPAATQVVPCDQILPGRYRTMAFGPDAPWYAIRIKGRRLPLILDAQGVFLDWNRARKVLRISR